MLKQKYLFFFVLISLCNNYLFTANAQFTIPVKPSDEKQTFVYDYIKLLSKKDSLDLTIKLKKYSDTTSTQIVVAIISSTKGENIAYLGARWLEKWGIGQANEDNGILITLAKEDRKININTGYGIEHLLTDALSRRIIERDIIPYFKTNDYSKGLNNGVDAIFEVLSGVYQGQRKSSSSNGSSIGFFIFFLILFIFFMVVLSKNKRKGGGSGGKQSRRISLLNAIILSNMGRSSGGFGGSSGGFGGGGFGGGMGGGGGATGSW